MNLIDCTELPLLHRQTVVQTPTKIQLSNVASLTSRPGVPLQWYSPLFSNSHQTNPSPSHFSAKFST
jgi:hypothetical protein